MQTDAKIAIFKSKKIRKTLHNNEWWFVINDVIESLTDSNDPAQYFKRLKQRDEELAKLTDKGEVQFVPPLMMPALVEKLPVTPVRPWKNGLKGRLFLGIII